MKFVTFSKNGRCQAGVLEGNGSGPTDRVFDLSHPAMAAALGPNAPSVADLVEAGLGASVDRIGAHGLDEDAAIPLSDVTLDAPIPTPSRIFGIAFNYRDALAERGMDPPEAPVLFMKDARTVISHDGAIILPEGIGGVTYEAELAAVIGVGGKNIPVDRALEHVAGYAAFNDISASEMIKKDGHFRNGKNLPTFGPFGPFLASSDEIPDPHNLHVWLEMDGERLQDSNTGQLVFGVADLISILSQTHALKPGDIIATGTPAGVAPARTPPTWIRPGATLAMSVERLGKLVNSVVEGPAYHG